MMRGKITAQLTRQIYDKFSIRAQRNFHTYENFAAYVRKICRIRMKNLPDTYEKFAGYV